MCKKNSYIIIFLIILALAAIFLFRRQFRIVYAGGKIFLAELAIDEKKQKEGLGGRKSLCRSCAMLFEFKEEGEWPFWMKGMNFDLDLIWISDGRAVFIKKNFSRQSKETIKSPLKADRVLEINSGLAGDYGIEVGDKISIY